ncbi:MAG: serine hydrolase [Bacteroidota bacterium]
MRIVLLLFTISLTVLSNTSAVSSIYPNSSVSDTIQEKQLALETAMDSLADIILDSGAAPGFQVLVAYKNHTLLHKAYGFHTYEKQRAVRLNDVYDLASITKIAASTVALMKLHEQGKVDLDTKLSKYWPDFAKTAKENITIREALAHYAQLQPYIVYWANTVKKRGEFKWFTFKADSSARFPVKVTEGVYLHRNYRKKIYEAIKKSPLLSEKKYVYSGLSFLLYPEIVKMLSGKNFDIFLKKEIYNPLGLTHLGFNPETFLAKENIVPTEYDSLFRKQLIHGSVHDEAAGMMGGVSGNAGLFSNAADLARLMQMLMNKGVFKDKQLIDSLTVKTFTSYQYAEDSVRRGLGFDKPKLTEKEKGYVAPSASAASFGHSGFTGTFTWADPEHQLVVVFLSNRVYPTRTNRKIYQLGIYRNFHQMVYDVLAINSDNYSQ